MSATMSSAASRTDVKASSAKSRSSPQPRKTRMVKRRGRGKDHFDSDDEFVREVGTDSESDDDRSSVASETDSDTEPPSEDIVPNGHSHILTPNTTQSFAGIKDLHSDSTPFFGAPGNDWSEMVAEETANGPAELPVIEFAEFNSPSIPQRTLSGPPPRKTGKAPKRPQPKRAVSAPSSDRGAAPQHAQVQPDEITEPVDDQPKASTSRQSSRNAFVRPSGHTARQAYKQRLEADPSYVPTVGEFWGHDDRLLDKDLRSLSGWWRARRQGRGRGRGGFSGGFMRGGGRGGFTGPESNRPERETPVSQETEKPPAETPPIDQPWTHDGFEEMNKRDEKRRVAAQHQQQQAARPARGFMPLRGRGGFVAGRGRGGFAPSPTRAQFVPPAAAAAASRKTWNAMRPENVWTKKHEGFLYFDHALKPRFGQGPGYRVKLAGKVSQVVRAPARTPQVTSEPAPSVAAPSEASEKTFIVRLPKRAGKEKASEPVVEAAETNTTVADAPIEDVFTVRPELVPPRQPIPTSQSAAVNVHVPSASVSAAPSKSAASAPSSPHVSTSSKDKITSPLLDQMMREAADQQAKETADMPNGILQEQYDQGAPALLQVEPPAANLEPSDAVRQSMPAPLQTAFSPSSQPSPPYGSPYGYGSSLPPGVAIGHHGMAYEIATGRPVYLQHPTMYTPRPLAHGMMTPPGLPYPMHHSNGSPDFLAPSHTPPINGFIDPTTGNPLFAFPRQSSRVEIRSPSLHSDPKSSKAGRRPSSLRMSAASFEPSRPASPNADSQYQTLDGHSAQDDAGPSHAADQPMPEQSMENAMYGYSPYHQQYYYPEHYGYSQYYDMSQVPQYEMYPTDPNASQAVYY